MNISQEITSSGNKCSVKHVDEEYCNVSDSYQEKNT